MFKMNLAGHSECAELLLEHGALVDELDVKVRVFSERGFISHEFYLCNIFQSFITYTRRVKQPVTFIRYERKLSGI